MECYSPIFGRKDPRTGKLKPVVSRAFEGVLVVSCGQCIGCKLERSRQWAVRCMHEAQMHPDNAFITLTYDDEHLPPNNSLRVQDWQTFAKALRYQMRKDDETLNQPARKLRFFHCGEYGETNGRAHLHALLFGVDFYDKAFEKVNREGDKLYTSATLDRLWGRGRTIVGSVTFESAAYCARYVLKKITGPDAEKHYNGRKPEYTTMSRRPGIGKAWIDTFMGDVYPSDECIVRGHPSRPPKFYDEQYKKANPIGYLELKKARVANASLNECDETPERLAVREQVKRAQINNFKRKV